MNKDDLPPPKRKLRRDEDSLGGNLGLTVSGLVWVAAFTGVAGLVLYAFVHWLR